jgi:hypothetical protein
MINKSRVKQEKKELQTQLDALLNKYNADEFTIVPSEMNEADNSLYLALDQSIRLYHDILSTTTDTVIIDNTSK